MDVLGPKTDHKHKRYAPSGNEIENRPVMPATLLGSQRARFTEIEFQKRGAASPPDKQAVTARFKGGKVDRGSHRHRMRIAPHEKLDLTLFRTDTAERSRANIRERRTLPIYVDRTWRTGEGSEVVL